MRGALILTTVFAGATIIACVPESPNSGRKPDDPNPGVSDAGSGTTPTPDAGTATPIDAGSSPKPDAGQAPTDAGTPDSGPPPVTGLPILGNGAHVPTSVTITPIVDPSDGLNKPTDLAFNPDRPTELWIVNQTDHSVTIADNPAESSIRTDWIVDNESGQHFLAKPSALAFGQPGTFATIHEEDRPTQQTTPADFMGPTLWSSSRSLFDGGHASHLDMLHNTPNGMGIAWAGENVYYVFDGAHMAIARYNFNRDHGPGGSDHSDGHVIRFAEREVLRSPGTPSHVIFDATNDELLIADTGNNRIAALDVTSGTRAANLRPNYDGITQYAMSGATVTTFVDGPSVGMAKPSGIELHDGFVFVSDNQLGHIFAFTSDGMLEDYLDTGLGAGALGGMAFDQTGRLFIVDMAQDRVLMIEAL